MPTVPGTPAKRRRLACGTAAAHRRAAGFLMEFCMRVELIGNITFGPVGKTAPGQTEAVLDGQPERLADGFRPKACRGPVPSARVSAR